MDWKGSGGRRYINSLKNRYLANLRPPFPFPKLDQVLPVVFSIDSPKGTKIWQEYKILKDYRDRLIHMKSSDMNNSGPDNMDDYIWSKLLDPVVLRAPEIATNMIRHFFSAEEAPRWLSKLVAKR